MDDREITEKLLTMFSHRGDALPTQYVNPDGPEAATEIASLRAERDALRVEVERLHGPVTTYKRGFGPADGESAIEAIGDGHGR